MPKDLEHELERRADRLHLHGDRRDAYIYGTLRRVEGRTNPAAVRQIRTARGSRMGRLRRRRPSSSPLAWLRRLARRIW